ALAAGFARGRLIVKVLPLPSPSLAATTLPPWSETRRSTSASPSPRPRCSRSAGCAPCTKGRKSWACRSGAMPWPSSWTARRAPELAHLALERRHSEARLAVLEFRAGEEIRRHGDSGERVAQLVREHGNELVLADIGLAQLADQRVQLGVEALALGDVARDLRGADDAALRIANRRDRERDVDQPAILRAAHGLEVVHRLAAAHLGEHHVFLGAALFGNDECDVSANRFLGAVAEHA